MARNPIPDIESGMLTPKEAGELLRIAPGTLAYWRSIRRGPPYSKLGPRNVRYPKSGLIAYAEAGMRIPTRAA